MSSLERGFPGHHFHGKSGNEQIVDAIKKRAHGTLAVCRMQIEPLGVAAADAHGRDALELTYGVNALLLEHSFRLSRVLGILHENAHDVDAAHENHVLADLVADLLSQHGQGNEGRNAKSDGKDNAITFLACDLAQGDAQEIGIGNHIGENPPLCSWIEAPRRGFRERKLPGNRNNNLYYPRCRTVKNPSICVLWIRRVRPCGPHTRCRARECRTSGQ